MSSTCVGYRSLSSGSTCGGSTDSYSCSLTVCTGRTLRTSRPSSSGRACGTSSAWLALRYNKIKNSILSSTCICNRSLSTWSTCSGSTDSYSCGLTVCASGTGRTLRTSRSSSSGRACGTSSACSALWYYEIQNGILCRTCICNGSLCSGSTCGGSAHCNSGGLTYRTLRAGRSLNSLWSLRTLGACAAAVTAAIMTFAAAFFLTAIVFVGGKNSALTIIVARQYNSSVF